MLPSNLFLGSVLKLLVSHWLHCEWIGIFVFFSGWSDEFIFPCRFNGALSLELSNDHPNMRIIHRKVALILGQWVSEVTWYPSIGLSIFCRVHSLEVYVFVCMPQWCVEASISIASWWPTGQKLVQLCIKSFAPEKWWLLLIFKLGVVDFKIEPWSLWSSLKKLVIHYSV